MSWWWRGWYVHNWTLDLAVDAIAPVDGDRTKGTAITVGSHDRLVMPAIVRITFADGSHEDIRLPVESWVRNSDTRVFVSAEKTVTSAEVDPDHRLPDRNRANNRLSARTN